MSKKLLCIIDANINRAREGIRVVEDLLRFYACNKAACKKFKEIRHEISNTAKLIAPLNEFAKARKHSTDVGAEISTKFEIQRENIDSIALANIARVSEALRVLEELSKLYNSKVSKNFKKLRMKIYQIESEALNEILKREKIENFRAAGLYVILDSRFSNGRGYLTLARQAIKGGAKIIQLRDKEYPKRKLVAVARKLKKLCTVKDVLFIINDYVDVAVAADADGVHLGHLDISPKKAREIIGYDKLIGYSTHSLNQAKAIDNETDYISVGPIFATKSKPEYKAVGVDLIRKIKNKLKVPFVAVGGIDEQNIDKVLNAGAERVAVIRAISKARNPVVAVKKLKNKIERRRGATTVKKLKNKS